MDFFTTISSNGTVKIPPPLLKDLGLIPGMPVQLHTKSHSCLEMRPAPTTPDKSNSIERLYGMGKGLVKGIVDVDQSIMQAVSDNDQY